MPRTSKYKVGDKVRIRDDLVIGRKYGKLEFTYAMDRFRTDTAYVTAVPAVGIYRLDELFFWDEEMLEDGKETGKA